MEQPVMFRGITCVDHERKLSPKSIYFCIGRSMSFEGIMAEAQFPFCRAWSVLTEDEGPKKSFSLGLRASPLFSSRTLLLELLKTDTPAESFAHRPAHII